IRSSSRSSVRPTSSSFTTSAAPIRSASAQGRAPFTAFSRTAPAILSSGLPPGACLAEYRPASECVMVLSSVFHVMKWLDGRERLGVEGLKPVLLEERLGLLDLIDADDENRLPMAFEHETVGVIDVDVLCKKKLCEPVQTARLV